MNRALSQVKNVGSLVLWPFRAARAAVVLRNGGFVVLAVDGELAELPSLRRRFLLPRGPMPTSIQRVRELSREVAADPKVRGVLVEIRSLRAGAAMATSLRDALTPIRAAGKHLVVHLPLGGGTREMLVASAGTRILGGPQASLSPLGVAIESRYLRRALDKVGVLPEIFARGEFKTAGEVLARDSMSSEQREQIGAILDAVHGELVGALAEGRNVARDEAVAWIDRGAMRAKDAAELGLLDGVAYEDEIPRLASGEERPKTIRAATYLGARRGLRFAKVSARRIGVVSVRGPIVSHAPVPMRRLAVDDRIIGALRSAREDASVPGVVLYVDSPGGSALASDRIHHEVVRLAEKKPVVAYFANVAASGGYYVSAGAHRIVAQPTTVTGSIGVVAAHFVVAPLLEKLGIVTERIRRGARADMMSPTRQLDEGEREALSRELDGFYRDFVGIVAKGRRRTFDEIDRLARGRVYSGLDAAKHGLVDVLGGFDRAVDEVKALVGTSAKKLEPARIAPPRTMPAPPPPQGPMVGLLDALAAIDGGPLVREATLLALSLGPTERLLAWESLDLALC